MNLVSVNKELFDSAVEHYKKDISSLRTGRATPAIVEDVMVEAYGMRQPLKAVASISVLDAKTLSVEPWDKSIVGAVDTALRNSSLGFNPVNDGRVIRIPLQSLSTERRAELVKVLHQKTEAAKIAVRKVREEVKAAIDKAEKNKEMSEDEKFNQLDELEKKVKEYNERIKVISEEKEKEINTI